jgi:hypothetical protein
MRKHWTKKCTCENFQQNEDCEHIGNKVLEEVGMPVNERYVEDERGNTEEDRENLEEQPEIVDHIHDSGDDIGLVDCLGCEKQMLKHFNNKKLVDIGIKDGCGQPVLMEEVGMQVEDSMGSYHIANTHIEEVGLGVGDKDCPDCKVNVGCAKHYIQGGDRHDRLEGALTPLGEKLYKPISPPVKVFYCQKCGQQLHPSIDEEWFDTRSGEKSCNFVWRCPNRGWNNNLLNTFWKPHTTVKTAEDGTELSKYSGM